jgi:hypothetical protein
MFVASNARRFGMVDAAAAPIAVPVGKGVRDGGMAVDCCVGVAENIVGVAVAADVFGCWLGVLASAGDTPPRQQTSNIVPKAER